MTTCNMKEMKVIGVDVVKERLHYMSDEKFLIYSERFNLGAWFSERSPWIPVMNMIFISWMSLPEGKNCHAN